MAYISGRYNIHAWEEALFGRKNKRLAHPDVNLYAQLTEAQIANDCRIIIESVEICRMTKVRDTFISRKKVASERYEHLQTLLPFADNKQKSLIKQTEEAMELFERR